MNSFADTGTGEISPLDTDLRVEITLRVRGTEVCEAEFNCSDDIHLNACAKALCGVILEKPVVDLFQMNANAVYYNLEEDLPRDKLFCASMAVTAAKRAAADYCKKNGIPYEHPDGCSCY